MRRVSLVFASSIATLLLLTFVLSRSAAAADTKPVLEKIKADNQAAISAFGASDFEEMKSKLLEAVALANDNGLAGNKILGQTYVLLGVLEVDGLKETDAGIRFFAKALDLSPAVQIPQGMANKTVKAAWKRAEDEEIAPEAARDELEKLKEGNAGKKHAAADAPEKARGETESEKHDKVERQENEKLKQEVAQAKLSESRGQAEKEKLEREKAAADSKSRVALLEKDKASRDKSLSDANSRIALLEKDKADRDKALADAKSRIALLEKDKADHDKALAATKDSETKERAAKEKLDKDRTEKDKALTDAKAKIALLEKDKADRDKSLAATKDSEAKEHAAREKAEKELQELTARDKDRKAKEDEERLAREKAEAGPEVPAHFGEPITCTVPDELEAGADLFVHCAPQPKLAAKMLVFYYRPAGAVVYNAAIMERSKKGWHVALIPGSRISGKLVQYYVEARDAKQEVAASNGKASSPNIATIRSGALAHRAKR